MPQTHSALIVDDESHQRNALAELLQQHFPQITPVTAAASVPEALSLLREHRPRLVFLDIMLPPYTGFDFLQQAPAIDFEIIFTTSFEEYAIKAFRLSAVDYLIKPLVLEELQQAIDRFTEKNSAKINIDHLALLMENIQARNQRPKKIALPTLTGYIFVTIDDIVRCESDNTYTTFYLINKAKVIVSKTLKECEGLLSDFSFFRVHNSHLVNLDYIQEYMKGEGGVIKMTDGSHVDVSRRRKDDFVSWFKGGKLKANV
ncbi:LytTR family DNA-binding domain-containing protein [Fulvivirgaceae bacterium PWU5]|uniref:LytTR family DNA-binding domain-containing protein n=2 Tax=Dawidia cretensis TaxID=2782350 RepID=A0AAP2GW23_9BACT|nr:LytTR family DNA-binding domain-containing protein [Dawidia cretensis]